jgi:hypothetical protein
MEDKVTSKVLRLSFQDQREVIKNRREVGANPEVQSDMVIEVLVVVEIQVLVVVGIRVLIVVGIRVLGQTETVVLVKIETKVPDGRIKVLVKKGALGGVGTGAPEGVETGAPGEVGIEVLGEGTEVQEEVGIEGEVGVPVVAPEEAGTGVLAVVQGEVGIGAPEEEAPEEASHQIAFGTGETVEGVEMLMKEERCT